MTTSHNVERLFVGGHSNGRMRMVTDRTPVWKVCNHEDGVRTMQVYTLRKCWKGRNGCEGQWEYFALASWSDEQALEAFLKYI